MCNTLQFIEKVTGRTGLTGDGLQPFTQKISEFSIRLPELSNSEFCLVDTPGLDSPTDDLEPFRNISAWLLKLYVSYHQFSSIHPSIIHHHPRRKKNRSLAGLLYFHSMGEFRWTSTNIWMLEHFKRYCGEECDRQICFTTTMWDTVGVNERTATRENELRGYLASVLDREVFIQRFFNNRESAIEIFSQIINGEGTRRTPPDPAANLVRTPSINRRKIFL